MLKASVSLWSADLLNLGPEIRRAEPHADFFHIDVGDGHYTPLLAFFPDLVAAIRAATRVPLDVHLIVERPERFVDPFADAGADIMVFYPDATDDPRAVIRQVKARGRRVGVSLSLTHAIATIEPYLDEIDLAVVMGTEVGVKGVDAPAEQAYDNIRELVRLRAARQLAFEIEADGAIRRETVPRLRQAGADIIVPGSLMFQNDMAEISRWLRAL